MLITSSEADLQVFWSLLLALSNQVKNHSYLPQQQLCKSAHGIN